MTGNDRDRDPREFDRTIGLEKQEALGYFRTETAQLRLRTAIAGQAGRTRVWRLWPIPALASTLVVLGLFLIVFNPPAPDGDRTKQIETALLLFQKAAADQPADPPCLVEACRTQSDRTWLIQAAIYRARRRHIRDQDIEKLIAESLAAEEPRFRTEAVSDEFIQRLGSRIRRTTIESALSGRRQKAGGS